MKTLAVSFLSLFLFISSIELSAQAPYRVGDVLLNEIEGPWIQVVIKRFRKQRYVLVLHGQTCIKDASIYLSSNDYDYIYDCLGLKDANGDLLIITHYIAAINLLEKHGFQLVEILPGEGYIMKRGKFEGKQLIDKVGSSNGC